MSVLRNVLSRGAAQMAKRGAAAAPVQRFAARSMATMLEGRERGEEAKFIRAMEADRQTAIRANIERILALEDGSEEKADLMEIIDKKADEESILHKLGLDDWKFALPVGMFIGIPCLANEVLVLDAETQLVACFILFCSTMYTQVGGMMAKSLDDYSKEIFDDLKAVDDAMLTQIHTAIAADTMVLSLDEDFKQYCTLTDQLAIAQADVLNHKEVHMYRDAIVKKLDSLHALEEGAVNAIKRRMMAKVKADVVDTFTNDKKVKEMALARAIEVLASGAKGKMGKDIVGEVFALSLSAYRISYGKQAPGSDPILVQLEKDMAAVATAPVVEAKGGNVYAVAV
mmetsp:Transcript_18232/g.40463  ORF Transcript_18232/g.40463 Transcript_18232/m.40463 type:complete len:342 (-) Transcript_18232:66-1091(-)